MTQAKALMLRLPEARLVMGHPMERRAVTDDDANADADVMGVFAPCHETTVPEAARYSPPLSAFHPEYAYKSGSFSDYYAPKSPEYTSSLLHFPADE